MAKKGKFNYFDAFEQQIEIALEESEILVEAIENFESADKLEDILKRAHEVEHRGDEVNHDIHTSVSVDLSSARTFSSSLAGSTTSPT